MKVRRGAWMTSAMFAGIAVIVTATAAAPIPPAQSNPFGGVFGRVVDHETGAPVRFAAVQIARVRMFQDGARSTVASEDGTFSIAGLLPGSYVLGASSPAYPPSYYAAGPPPVPEPGTPVPVKLGAETGPLEIRLTRGGVITGRITDSNGEPMTGVSVEIKRWPPVVNPGQSPFYFASRDAYSDVNGVYRAFGLAAGQYIVSSSSYYAQVDDPATKRPRKYVRVFFPDTTDPAATVPVEVLHGRERTGVDFRMRIASLFNVSGTSTAPPDANVEHISVSFRYAGGAADPDLSFTSGRRWIQTHVPPGNYVVTAFATEPHINGPQPAEGRLWWAAAPVTVSDQDVSGIALVLQSSSIVTGRIVVDGADTTAASIARPWIVTLSPIPSAPPLIRYPPIVAGRVDASGQFAIRNVTPGRYVVRLDGAPTDTAAILGVSAGDRVVINGEVEISAGSTIDNLAVRVRR